MQNGQGIGTYSNLTEAGHMSSTNVGVARAPSWRGRGLYSETPPPAARQGEEVTSAWANQATSGEITQGNRQAGSFLYHSETDISSSNPTLYLLPLCIGMLEIFCVKIIKINFFILLLGKSKVYWKYKVSDESKQL